MTPERIDGSCGARVEVMVLGSFSISLGGRTAGPWPRPTAKRLCELVLISPGQRASRDLLCEELFVGRSPERAAAALSRALSMARSVLSDLGGSAAGLLQSDRANVWPVRRPLGGPTWRSTKAHLERPSP